MSLTDRVSGTLQKVHNTMNRVHSVGSSVSNSIKAQARAMYDLARASDVASQKMNKLNQASTGANLIKGAITGATIAAAVATAKKAMSISDEYANMNARLNMINDGMQSTSELQKSIFTSAQRTGSAYTEMANGVAKMRMQAGDVFQNNGETIAFLETMNKSFVVGGASIEEQKSAMMQLTQAMASGKLQGDELRSLAETSPALIQAIATKLGVTRGEVKKLGADGKITADIVKTAMLEASEKIDEQFRNMPMTWGRAWQNFINYMTKAFEPLSIKINQIANSAEFQQFASMVASVIQIVINALIVLMNIIGAIWSKIAPLIKWIADNWSTIAPIIIAVAGAMFYYWLSVNAVSFAMKGLEMAMNLAKGAVSAFNAVLAMGPIGWVIMGIIILIGVIYAAVNAFNQWAGTSISATGIIIGSVFALGMTIWNILMWIFNIVILIINGIIAFVVGLVNIVIASVFMIYQFILMILAGILGLFDWLVTGVINLALELVFQFQTAWYNIAQGGRNMAVAIGNFVSSMVNGVISLVEGMINGILSGINGMIGFLNGMGLNIGAVGTVTLGRVDFGNDIGNAIDSMEAPVKKTFEGLHLADGIVNHLESLGDAPSLQAPQIGSLGYGDVGGAFNTGYEIGQGIDKAVGDMFSGSPGDVGNSFLGDNGQTPYELSPANNTGTGDGGKSANPKGGHLDRVGKIDDEVKLDSEFIKLVQDVATMKWQQNFITLKPEIVTNIDSINSDREYGNMLDDLNATIVDAINNGADGLAY
uniref:Tail tape measure n=1 Tax=Siphoviridae sp. ctFNZ2 TaxID=2823572 RepID=A0A8S5LAA5_9CAUD|nr:MAG TPA: tail tape measure [Siphoviridae sp. ctFNZ2]